jgi:hypothetical protein
MSLYLDSGLVSMDNIIAALFHLIFDCLILSSLSVIFCLIQDSSISCECNMLSYLDILFSSFELFQLLLQIINNVLGQGSFAAGSMFHSTLRRTKIEMLHDFVFGDIILVYFLVIVVVMMVSLWYLTPKSNTFVSFRNFETTRESTPHFIQKFGYLLCHWIISLESLALSNRWNFGLWVKRTHLHSL